MEEQVRYPNLLRNDWSRRQITTSAQSILTLIPFRASDRGLYVVDSSTIVMLALWSLLQWERKIGRVALEQSGADRFLMARDLDWLPEEKKSENPVAYDKQRNMLVLRKTGQPYEGWDFDALLEPLLCQAEREAKELGHNYIGSEHLLLAIVRTDDPALKHVFESRKITHDLIREIVLDLLGMNRPQVPEASS